MGSNILDNALGRGRFGDVDSYNTYIETRDMRGSVNFNLLGEIKEYTTDTQPDGWILCDGHIMTEDEKAQYKELAILLSGDSNLVDSIDPFNDGSLVAKYQLNGDATDLCGNYDGDATDVTYEEGKYSEAGKFNGSSSYVKLPSDLPIYGTDTNAISMLFYLDNLDSDTQLIDIIKDLHYRVTFNTDGTASVWCGAKEYVDIDSTDFRDFIGKWGFIALSFDADNGRHIRVATLDGEIDNDYSFDALARTEEDIDANIGASHAEDVNFNGLIDQVEIYSKALTPDEKSRLYKQTVRYELPLKNNSIYSTSYYIKASGVTEGLPLQDEGFLGTVKTFHTAELVPDNYNVCSGSKIDPLSEYGKYLIGKGILNTVDDCDIFKDGSGKALYQFNGDATDKGGNYDLSIGTDPVFVEDGHFDTCIKLGQNTDLQIDDKDFGDTIVKTVTGWFYAEAGYDAGNRYLFDPRGDANTGDYVVMNDTWEMRDVNSVRVNLLDVADGDTHSEYGKWHFVTVELSSNVDHLTIGDYHDTSSTAEAYSWGDRIEQVRVFNRELTVDEEKTLFSEGLFLPYIEDTENVKYRIKTLSLPTSELKSIEAPHYKLVETLTNQRWVDGKPIYRKVYDIGTIDNDLEFSIGDLHIGDFFVAKDFFAQVVGTDSTASAAVSFHETDDNEVGVSFRDKETIKISTLDGKDVNWVVVIEYTKAIDTAESPIAYNYVQVDYKDAIMGDLSRYDESIANLGSLILANTADINGILIEDLND